MNSPPHSNVVMMTWDWESLRSKSCAELRALGCQHWDAAGLMLFPASWFDRIPTGFEVVTINGATRAFSRSMSRDCRAGVLAFGIIGAAP